MMAMSHKGLPRRPHRSFAESLAVLAPLISLIRLIRLVPLVRLIRLVPLVLVAGLGLAATPAGAESPQLVADEVAVDGVFVAPGRTDLMEEELVTVVQQARARGLRLIVVAPLDPAPDAAAFARRVQEASDVDAAIVFPLEGGVEAHVIDDLELAHLRALGAARSKASPVDAVEAYTAELLAEPIREMPAVVNQLVTVVVLLALILAAAVAVEQFLRRLRHSGQLPADGAGSTLAVYLRRLIG